MSSKKIEQQKTSIHYDFKKSVIFINEKCYIIYMLYIGKKVFFTYKIY